MKYIVKTKQDFEALQKLASNFPKPFLDQIEVIEIPNSFFINITCTGKGYEDVPTLLIPEDVDEIFFSEGVLKITAGSKNICFNIGKNVYKLLTIKNFIINN